MTPHAGEVISNTPFTNASRGESQPGWSADEQQCGEVISASKEIPASSAYRILKRRAFRADQMSITAGCRPLFYAMLAVRASLRTDHTLS